MKFKFLTKPDWAVILPLVVGLPQIFPYRPRLMEVSSGRFEAIKKCEIKYVVQRKDLSLQNRALVQSHLIFEKLGII